MTWTRYTYEKPSKSGVYLAVNLDIDPPMRVAAWYDPIYGWTGTAHILERVIKYWAEFPEPK